VWGAFHTEMGTEGDRPDLEARLATLASRQFGVVTRAQLRRLGVGEHGIAERVRTQRLHRIHRGVYAVGHRALRPEAFRMAAVLACGPGAVLSHAAAAAHLGIRPSSATRIDVSVPARSGRRHRPGIRIHRCGRLDRSDVAVYEGIPTTTVARTLLHLADQLSEQSLKRTIDEAEYRRLLDMTAVIAAVRRNPGRSGGRLLRAAGGAAELTRSVLEDRFLELVRRRGLPRPLVGAHVEGYELDFYWPGARLVVEIDGFQAHGTRSRFEADRLRDRRLWRRGLQTMRLTASALRYDEDEIAADLEAALSCPRASANPSRRDSTSSASAM
jgi:very-short-patch-repair endonuclease